MKIISTALAFTQNSVSTPIAPITTTQGLIDLGCTIFDWMFYALIVFAIIMVVLAAFNYVTAGDNAEKVSKATKMIIYAAIGIAVALLAMGIPLLVGNFLNVSNTTGLTTCS
jgi:uncharacterized YccA/Bax inhibitor family protein